MQQELETLQQLTNLVVEFLVKYSFQIIGAFIILLIGIKLAGWLGRAVTGFCEKHKIDITLSRFLGNLVKVLTITFVIIIAIGKFGISIAPFIAALGALAFGSSFAIQGPLSNYGAGISIILTKPFKVGNTISVKGVSGVVEEIRLAATVLTTEDSEVITIPNKHIVGEILLNSFANKIVESSVGISYDDDPDMAVSVLKDALADIPEISLEPPPQIGIAEFADSAINIGLRYWVPTKKYFQVQFKVNQIIHQALTKAGINIPFPQRDVHLIDKTV
jgi:small conductance mechanosensitive channel